MVVPIIKAYIEELSYHRGRLVTEFYSGIIDCGAIANKQVYI